MASYKTHNYFNTLLLLPISLCVIYFYRLHAYALPYSAGFIYATLFFSPDVDLSYKVKPLSLRGILSYPLRSYSYLFRHRGFSHYWLLGTISRVLWLIIFFSPLIAAGIFFPPQWVNPVTSFAINHLQELLWIFLGFLAADTGHLLLDLLIR